MKPSLFRLGAMTGGFLLVVATNAMGAPRNAFFAMDTIARGGPDVVPTMLRELGYAGLGGKALDAEMPKAIAAQQLKFFNGYHVMTFAQGQEAPDAKLSAWFVAMRGQDTTLWLAIRSVARGEGVAFPTSSTEADE